MTPSQPMTLSSSWRLRPLLLSHFLIALGILSLFFLPTFWNILDLTIFHFLNAPLKENSLLRIFWALANHSLADWLEDLCILGFYIFAILKTEKEKRLEKGAQLFFCILLTALTILIFNRLICRDCLQLRRESPSLALDSGTSLADFLPWIEFKVISSKSFPGDHATTALMFAFSYAYLVRGKLALGALLYGFFLCLPRLAVGAHWFSDIFIGSGSIVLFSLSWAFFTPLAEHVTLFLEKCLKKGQSRLQT